MHRMYNIIVDTEVPEYLVMETGARPILGVKADGISKIINKSHFRPVIIKFIVLKIDTITVVSVDLWAVFFVACGFLPAFKELTNAVLQQCLLSNVPPGLPLLQANASGSVSTLAQ